MRKLEDESIRLDEGKLAFVSLDRFRDRVCSGQHCLVCADASADTSTREHIIPDWILKRLSLHDKSITLPNSTLHPYGQYVIPCCSSCNALMGKELEVPLSQAFESGFDSFNRFLQTPAGQMKLFAWLSFIFIKSHYKDLKLAYERDRRLDKGSIAEELKYDWGDMHHIYCLARSIYSEANVTPDAMGSLAIVPILNELEREAFDLIDLTVAKTIGIRIGEVGVIAVFGDGGAVFDQMERKFIKRISGPLGFAQFRELVANFACCSLHHKNPPHFASYINTSGPEAISICCSSRDPRPEFAEFEPKILGGFLDLLLHKPLKNVIEDEDYQKRLKEASISFLFDGNGNFINLQERVG